MRNGDLTYDDYLRRLNIQDVLIDAGYRLNRRDGLRYPSYVRTDSEGRRIRGDKFIVTANVVSSLRSRNSTILYQSSRSIRSFLRNTEPVSRLTDW